MKERIYLQSGFGDDSAEIEVDTYRTVNASSGKSGHSFHTIIIVPGATPKNYPAYQKVYDNLAADLANSGHCAITFSPRGHSGSGGLYNHKHVLEDISSIMENLENNNSKNNLILFGRSAGAGIAAEFANNDNRVAGLALWGGPPRIDAWFTEAKRAATFDKFKKIGIRFNKDRFLNSIINLEDNIGNIKVPLLLFAGSEDEYTSPAEQYSLWSKVTSKESMFCMIKGARHSLDSSHEKYEDYSGLLIYWIEKIISG